VRETPIVATQKYVQGVTWPVSKEDLLTIMERNGAPADVLQALNTAPKPRFTGPSEVTSALWGVV